MIVPSPPQQLEATCAKEFIEHNHINHNSFHQILSRDYMRAPAEKQLASSRERPITIRFNDAENTTRTFDLDPLVKSEEIWYQSHDYDEMKLRSRHEAREWRRQGFGCLLQDTFELPTADVQTRLTAFVRLEEEKSRRGLERFLCRQHGEERSAMKDRARQSVLIHQRRLQREGAPGDEITENVACMYREVSRSASVFARRLGMADELVVKQGEDSALAQEIVDLHQKLKSARPRMERRLSNYSAHSTGTSVDSKRLFPSQRKPLKHCPSSPSSPTDEFYAAIA
jgi:hypothetical protein